MSDGAIVLRANALHLPLPDESVDLIVTSPPYFAQRSYKDGGEHFDGQLGSEPQPQEFLEALWTVSKECWRVLKPSGSMFVNLGDKRSGSGGPGTTSGLGVPPQGDRTGITGSLGQRGLSSGEERNQRAPRSAAYMKAAFGRAKSKQLLPQRYAIGCEDGAADPDGIGWIVRAELIWQKLNGLPESVRDRVRDQHEPFWHLTKDGDYYSAVDELREPHAPQSLARSQRNRFAEDRSQDGVGTPNTINPKQACDPMGRLPGSVWPIAGEPLAIPKHLGIDHFAAFPSEWPRRLILGWSPPAICLECGEGRRPVVEVMQEAYREGGSTGRPKAQELGGPEGNGWNGEGYPQTASRAQILGYSCACTPFTDHPGSGEPHANGAKNVVAGDVTRGGDLGAAGRVGPWREHHLLGWTSPPSRPAVVLDPFGGTGTTAMVARALGRLGISVDLSADYCRLASWRIFESGHAAKAIARTNGERQGTLL